MKANQHRLVRSIFYITITMANILASCGTPPPIAPVPQPMFTIVSIPQAKPRQEILPAPRSRVVKASWYGHAFAGHKTTSGELYNPESLTAASKTFPLGTVVKVSNPQNGKSVRVRINDRGPFVRGRSLDLSHRAAKALGILHKGVTRVKVQKLTSPSMESRGGSPVSQAIAEEESKASNKDEIEH